MHRVRQGVHRSLLINRFCTITIRLTVITLLLAVTTPLFDEETDQSDPEVIVYLVIDPVSSKLRSVKSSHL
jgi:hypothetical protein